MRRRREGKEIGVLRNHGLRPTVQAVAAESYRTIQLRGLWQDDDENEGGEEAGCIDGNHEEDQLQEDGADDARATGECDDDERPRKKKANEKWFKTMPLFHQGITVRQEPLSAYIQGSAVFYLYEDPEGWQCASSCSSRSIKRMICEKDDGKDRYGSATTWRNSWIL